MAVMQDIIGQHRAKAALTAAHRSDRFHHAWIFSGPFGIGKFTTAMALARTLLDPEADVNAGALLSSPPDSRVAQRIDAGTHPDLHVIRKELALTSDIAILRQRKLMTIPIDLLREQMLGGRTGDDKFREAPAYLRPSLGHGKVFIIDEAELLDWTGQNALLKTLEQPPPQTYIILVTSRPAGLLPTIRSRCQLVTFTPLDQSAMEQWLDAYLSANRYIHGLPKIKTTSRADSEKSKKKTAKKSTRAGQSLLGSAGRSHSPDAEADTPPLIDPSLARDATWRTWLLGFADGSPGLASMAVEYELYRWADTLEPMFDQLERGSFPIGRGDALNKLIDAFASTWVDRHPNASKDAANKDGLSYLLRMFARRARQRLTERVHDGGDPHPWPAMIQMIGDAEGQAHSNVNRRMVLENLVSQWFQSLQGEATAGVGA